MHPTVRQQLMTSQVSDLHRNAGLDRLALAARRGRRIGLPGRPRPSRGIPRPVTGSPVRRLARRLLTALAARTA